MSRAPSTAATDPTLSDLLGEHLDPVLADCERHTGPITGIARAVGGNVSHVFRIAGPAGTVIVKVRGDRFWRIPALTTDPALIADEHAALRLYGRACPGMFPTPIALHRAAAALVMTDVFPDGLNYHQHLDQRPATAEETARLGSALDGVHRATRDLTVQVRSQGDDWFRAHTLDFALRHGHPALEQACAGLEAREDHQLVLGDAAPKNLSLAGGTVAFCDLDNVHRNSPIYDLGYVTAHLLLHHLRRPDLLPGLLNAFTAAYHRDRPAQSPSDRQLTAAVAAGVVLYRLDGALVPFTVAGPAQLADRFAERVRALLDHGPFTVFDLLTAAGAEP